MKDDKQKIVMELVQHRVLQIREVITKSGKKSPYFINLGQHSINRNSTGHFAGN